MQGQAALIEPRPGINTQKKGSRCPAQSSSEPRARPSARWAAALSSLDATDLGGHAIEAALERSGVDPEQVQQVVFGQVLQAGQGQIPSRQAQIKGGIPKEVPSETINKVCASGMRSIGIADMAIRAGDTEVAVTGGMESMSQAPAPAARRPLRLPDGPRRDDRRDGPRRPHQPLHRKADDQRGERGLQRAGDHPRRHGPLRRALAPARRRGDRRRPPRRRDRRRHGQVAQGRERRSRPTRRSAPDTTVETLAGLRAIGGEDATHTAGNAPGVNDGAGAIVVASEEWAESEGRTPLARVLSYGTVADDFPYLAKTPANAAKQALEKIGKSPEDVDLWEINEAFASVALNSMRMLGVDEDKVNVNGGAIALGHPIGASGARIVGCARPRARPPRRRPRRRRDLLRRRSGRRDRDRGRRPVARVSRAAAFFDLDKTLMAGSSGMQFARVAASTGIVSRRQLASWGVEHLRYRLRGTTDERTGEVLRAARELIAGVPARDLERMNPEVMAAILPRVYPQMLDEVHAHQDAGRADLHRQRRRQRRGRAAGPACSAWTAASAPATRSATTAPSPAASTAPSSTARARSRRCEAFAAEHEIDLAASYAYSDSLSDLPMLRAVGNPVVVNPDPPLAEIARDEGWQTMRFERLGRRLRRHRGHPAGDRRRLRRLAHRRPPQAAAPPLRPRGR